MSRAGLAAQIGAWGNRWPASGYGLPEAPNAAPPVTFPAQKLRIRVELQLGPFGIWTDISAYVLYEDKIKITRGRLNERSTAPAASCKLTLKNQDRRFSPRNINGPWYGQFGRNTGLRVWINPGSGDSLRFTGEVSVWPPRWTSPNDRTVAIEANGIQRRLEQGDTALRSPMFISITAANPVAYYPMEEPSGSTAIASGIPGDKNMNIDGTMPTFAADSGLTGSSSNPKLAADTSLSFAIDLNQFSGQWQVDWFQHVPATFASDTIMMRIWTAGGTVAFWQFIQSVSAGTPTMRLTGYDPVGTVLVDSGLFAAPEFLSSAWSHVRVMVKDAGGGNAQWAAVVFPLSGAGGAITGTYAGTPGAPYFAHIVPQANLADIAYGHWAVYAAYDFSATDNSARGWGPDTELFAIDTTGILSETPAERFARLCAEAGIPYVVSELVADTEIMGIQRIAKRFDLLRECEEVSEGLIDETFANELRLTSRTARYNQIPAIIADYEHPTYGNQIYDIKPDDGDFALRNDWTITRQGGITEQAVLDDGSAVSITDPPIGVGRYDDSKTLILGFDSQVIQHAKYRVAKGAVDELRYPMISFAFHRNPELIPAWLSADVHSRVQVRNPPDDVGQSTIDQIIEGYAEEFDQFTWTADTNTSPVESSLVGAYSSTAARYDCGGSTLTSDIDASTTSIALTITDRCVWAHDHGDYSITVDGETMLVTAVAAATGSYPAQSQTLTVTRSTNGITATHAAGTSVRLTSPARYAL